MVGLEHAASVLQEVILGGGGSWEQFAKVISRTPAKIAGLDGQGDLKIGSQANITLIDPSAKRTISSKTHSKSSNNPFKGMTLPGQVVHTLYKGKFTVKDSELQGND
jgi:dihydroorotase